jgi:flavin reductase (DIM6/NTAB) family NADH-FMN oxidoreductase RutF
MSEMATSDMEINPEQLPWQAIYKIMISSILPRPIGWISTIDQNGQPNLAPFSFFNAVCANPPHLLFCPMVRATDRQPKDTLRNVRETGEFVVNLVTEELAQAMNLTSAELPGDVDEFTFAGLAMSPSLTVRPPRLAASPIHYECQLAQIIDLGEQPGAGSVVIGRVLHLHVSEQVLSDGDRIDLSRLRPVGRLSGNAYCRVTDIFELIRPPSQIKPSPAG